MPAEGFEPPTPCLQGRRSTPELCRHTVLITVDLSCGKPAVFGSLRSAAASAGSIRLREVIEGGTACAGSGNLREGMPCKRCEGHQKVALLCCSGRPAALHRAFQGMMPEMAAGRFWKFLFASRVLMGA